METNEMTKQERKEQRKMEKLTETEAIKRQQQRQKYFKYLVIAIIAGLLGWWLYSRYVPIPSGEGNKPVDQVLEGDWYLGDRNAPVKIIEYSDLQCPACKLYSPLLEQLNQKYGNQIVIVYRHFPLKQIHAQAELAAAATEAAGKQGKFWEMNRLLFERQLDWAGKRNAKQLFTTYAKELGLNESQFSSDISSKIVKGLVKADYMSALTQRLNGTPSFFVNGERITNPQGLEAFSQIIDPLVTATGSATYEQP